MAASRHSVSPSVPGSSPKRPGSPASSGPSPTSHYNPSTGAWDGQLPHPDIVDEELSVAGILEKPSETWPSIIERDNFVDLAAVTLQLSACQTAVFRRICFRAGSASQGCWESQENIALYLGYKRRAVQRALDHLQDLGLIHRVATFHGSGKSNCYVPIFRISHLRTSDANEDSDICVPEAQMDRSNPPICASDDRHLRTSDAQTEGTDHVLMSHESKEDVTLSESKDVCNPKYQSQNQFICVPEAQMETGADIPECHVCRLPWTSDVGRHWTALRRGLKEFLCDACREAQIAASGVMDMVATAYTGPALVHGECGAGLPASPDLGAGGILNRAGA